eukprot:Gb_03758 [translate_table: standard]
MDQSLDFSFCQGNLLADTDQLGSPKPMPRVSDLHINDESNGPANNQELKVDSLTASKIFDVPSPKVKATRTLGSSVSGVSLSTAKGSVLEKPISTAKPLQRAKVPFEKGYSQMDWLKLTQTHPDLAGLKGRSNRRLISMDEVKQHKSEGDIWTVLKGRVYNISPYMKFHPGGLDMLMKASGRDCTALFNKYHAWVNAEFLLEKCLVGFLDIPAD